MAAGHVNDRLRAGTPSIVAADRTKFRPSCPGLGIFAGYLREGEEKVIVERVRAILSGKG